MGKDENKDPSSNIPKPEAETTESHLYTSSRKARLVSCEEPERNALPQSFLGNASAALVQGLGSGWLLSFKACLVLQDLCPHSECRDRGGCYTCADIYFEQANTKRFIPLAALLIPMHVTQSLSVLCSKTMYYKTLSVQSLPCELDHASRMHWLPLRSTMFFPLVGQVQKSELRKSRSQAMSQDHFAALPTVSQVG